MEEDSVLKKIFKGGIAVVIFIATAILICFMIKIMCDNSNEKITFLSVKNGVIVNENGKEVILKGISSHGYQWFPEMLSKENFNYLKKSFKTNTFRIALYVNNDLNIEEQKNGLYEKIDELISLNQYVIVDWHVLENGDPNTNIEEAKLFFDEVSAKYSETPNVIYEICNEPNGNKVTWNDKIKPYSEEIIPVIRKNSPKSLIIVGTPEYSKRIDKAKENPLKFDNIVYAVHFYAGSDGEYLRNKIKEAKDSNMAILISEWGTTDYTGDGRIYADESEEWIKFLKENKIGYINWSFCNKDEGSALFKPEYNTDTENKKLDDYLTESGKLVKKLYT